MAKHYAKMTFFLSMSFAAALSLTLFILRKPIAELFTDDPVLIEAALFVMPIFCLSNLLDMALMCFQGFVRALALQANVALLTILCFYVVSIPMAAYLAFSKGFGIAGLWWGYISGIAILVSIVVFIVVRTDWHYIVYESEYRLLREAVLARDPLEYEKLDIKSNHTMFTRMGPEYGLVDKDSIKDEEKYPLLGKKNYGELF